MRTEKDSLGEVRVPEEALYGAHTARSLGHFDGAGEPVPLDIIHAMVRLKWACALANVEAGGLEKAKGDAIAQACREALAGRMDDAFPLDVFQAGSGTSSNMNVNEVLANRACEILGGRRGERGRVHPNDDVNRGQSTNNVFPSAIRVACVLRTPSLLSAVKELADGLRAKEREFHDVIKSGRTHLQDAVPVTLGQEFGAWARAVEKAMARIETAAEALREIGIGGNAIGTGINTSRAFRPAILRELGLQTGVPFRAPQDGIEATQFLTDVAQFSSALRLLAADVRKICGDLRLLASGPNTAIGEIRLPAVEAGSSIMPGKINPSICEAATMACLAVMGYDHAAGLACGDGQLELNTHMPVAGWMVMRSMRTLERTVRMLSRHAIAGIEACREQCARNFERSAGLATILNPILGYDRVAALVKESLAGGRSLRDLVFEKQLVSEEDWTRLLQRATGPQ